MDTAEQYKQWRKEQPALKTGKTYQLLHFIDHVAGQQRVAAKLIEKKGNDCLFYLEGWDKSVTIREDFVYFEIYNAGLPA